MRPSCGKHTMRCFYHHNTITSISPKICEVCLQHLSSLAAGRAFPFHMRISIEAHITYSPLTAAKHRDLTVLLVCDLKKPERHIFTASGQKSCNQRLKIEAKMLQKQISGCSVFQSVMVKLYQVLTARQCNVSCMNCCIGIQFACITFAVRMRGQHSNTL